MLSEIASPEKSADVESFPELRETLELGAAEALSGEVGFNPDAFESDEHAVWRKSIYRDLASHQRGESWFGRDLIEQLQIWAGRFDAAFDLGVREIALRIDSLPCTRYGHFRLGHNGFGLKGEVALNSRYLNDRPYWQVLGTLLHELLHAWQETQGHPSRRDHHNKEFRRRALQCGLVIDRRGVTTYPDPSPFKDLLWRYGVDASAEAGAIPARTIKGKSKLRKWSCDCTNVRCAVATLNAVCLSCNRRFVPAD